jgi:hypothetical protein
MVADEVLDASNFFGIAGKGLDVSVHYSARDGIAVKP